MLNRTNRTLSANLNRLNLGTRSLVLLENGNLGKDSSRIHHDQDFAMRARMFASSDPAIQPQPRIRISDILGSTSVVPTWPGVAVVVRPPATESATGWAYPCAEYARLVQTETRSKPGSVKPKRKPSKGLRSEKVGTTGTARNLATRTAVAAIVAATAGG